MNTLLKETVLSNDRKAKKVEINELDGVFIYGEEKFVDSPEKLKMFGSNWKIAKGCRFVVHSEKENANANLDNVKDEKLHTALLQNAMNEIVSYREGNISYEEKKRAEEIKKAEEKFQEVLKQIEDDFNKNIKEIEEKYADKMMVYNAQKERKVRLIKLGGKEMSMGWSGMYYSEFEESDLDAKIWDKVEK